MCGRYYLVTSIETIARLFGVDLRRGGSVPALAPRYNIAPQQMIPIVRVRDGEAGPSAQPVAMGDGAALGTGASREVAMVSWGFVPSWTSDLRDATKPINARCETAGEKPMFRDAIARRRCIVPADGWYEWQVDPATGNKTPQLMRVLDEAGRPMCFAMAGVWEAWQNRDPDPSRRVTHESCAILTTAAAKSCAHVHDRMPVILPLVGGGEGRASAVDRWLDPHEKNAGALASLLRPLEDVGLSITRVSRRVNSPRNDGPDLIEPAGDEDILKADPTPSASRSRGERHGEDPSQGSLFGP